MRPFLSRLHIVYGKPWKVDQSYSKRWQLRTISTQPKNGIERHFLFPFVINSG